MKTAILFCSVISIASLARAQSLPVLHPKYTVVGTVRDTTVNWQAAGSPNGKFIAYTSSVGDFRLYDVRAKRSTVLTSAIKWASWPSWSPASDVIAFTYASDGRTSVYAIDVDPNTGVPRGNPRRVTVGGGVNASISPDGKLVAYNKTDDDSKPVTDLLLVPANGGAPKTIAHGELAMPTRWSPDGRWIYYVTGTQPSSPGSARQFDTYRVRADGTGAERISGAAGTWPGLTNDGRFIVTRDGNFNDTQRHSVVADATGKRLATFTSPYTDDIGHWIDNYRFLTVRDDQQTVLKIADIDGKWTRDVPTAGHAVASATFSPDARRIASFERNGIQRILIVSDVDGRNKHTAGIKGLSNDARPVWSPDGRYVAFIAAQDIPAAIHLYDTKTNSEKTLVRTEQRISRTLRWRPSGKAILYSRASRGADSPDLATLSMREVTIDGRDREIQILPHKVLSNGKVPTEIMPGDSAAISVGSAGVWTIPYNGGAPRLLKRETTTRTTLTPNGRALVHGVELAPDGSFRKLEVLGIDGTVMRTIALPFNGFTTSSDRHVVLTPNGRDAVLVGRDENAATAKIYRVPLDGSAPRAIATVASRFSSHIDVAPDGKSILYTVAGPEATSFVVVDLTAELSHLSSRH